MQFWWQGCTLTVRRCCAIPNCDRNKVDTVCEREDCPLRVTFGVHSILVDNCSEEERLQGQQTPLWSASLFDVAHWFKFPAARLLCPGILPQECAEDPPANLHLQVPSKSRSTCLPSPHSPTPSDSSVYSVCMCACMSACVSMCGCVCVRNNPQPQHPNT